MASAKKGKKNKGKTLALSDFLQETPGAVTTMPIRKSAMNWADEVEDSHDMYDSRAAKANVVLPTAPKASRDFDDIIDKVPQDPPYIAYLTNLPYDVDEEEITAFFRNMKIAHMRIPKDERPGEPPRLRGFGYVEFEDRESLLNALVIPDTTIKNRRIRIEVATDYGNDNRRTGGRMDMNRERRSDMSSFGDWRSGPRQESNDGERRGFSREREREKDDSMWRSNRESDKSFSRSRDDRDQDFGRSRDDKYTRRFDSDRGNRNGGFTRGPPRDDDRREGGFTRGPPRDDDRRDGGFTRGPPRDDDRREGGFTRGPPRDDDRREGGFTRGPPRDEERRDEPRQRQKLMLTPRTKPIEVEPEKPASSASIFGNAKPVDTSARERQIEERLARDHEPPRREPSRERKEDKEKENVVYREKKVVEHEESKSQKATDANGVVEKSHQQSLKRNGDVDTTATKKEPVKVEKTEVKKKEEKKEKPEKEMPKLKKAEPPNFIASNKFAYLQTEDSSD